MGGFWEAVGRHYERDVVDAGKQPQFFILIAFVLTFVLVRFITHSIRSGRVKIFKNVSAGGTHIHHLVWGILLLLATGYLSIGFDARRELLAVLFGIGAALTLDEFALWLNLKDVYWSREGRRSIDAVVVFTAIAGLALLGLSFWVHVAQEVGRLA